MTHNTKNGFLVLILLAGVLTSCSQKSVFLAGHYEIIAQDVKAGAGQRMVWFIETEGTPVDGVQNMAILSYTGRSDSTMKFAYEEFSGVGIDSTGQPEFHLDLEYDLDEKFVVYRDISIEVIEVTSDQIKFNIIARTTGRRNRTQRPSPVWM